MEFFKDGWTQAGAVGVLFVAMAIVIWRLYVDSKAERKRNNDFGERVLTVAVESRKALEVDGELKQRVIDRLDRMAR